MEIIETIWSFQKRYLETLAAEAALALQPVTRSDYYCRMRYLMARRRSSVDSGIWRQLLLDSPGFRNRPLLDWWLWRISPALPAGPMTRLLEITMTQNWAKEWITRLLRVGA
jgi:hypothetical protein